PKGCAACNDSGYKGRMGVHELLVGTDELKRAIQRKSAIDELRSLALQQGMRTLLQDAIEKAFKGITDIKQARAIAVKYVPSSEAEADSRRRDHRIDLDPRFGVRTGD